MTLRNLLDCSLVREEKTDGETTIKKKALNQVMQTPYILLKC